MARVQFTKSSFLQITWSLVAVVLVAIFAAFACVSINRAFPFAIPPTEVWGHMFDSRHHPAGHASVPRPAGHEDQPPSSFAHVTPKG